eukprot:gene28-1184_t
MLRVAASCFCCPKDGLDIVCCPKDYTAQGDRLDHQILLGFLQCKPLPSSFSAKSAEGLRLGKLPYSCLKRPSHVKEILRFCVSAMYKSSIASNDRPGSRWRRAKFNALRDSPLLLLAGDKPRVAIFGRSKVFFNGHSIVPEGESLSFADEDLLNILKTDGGAQQSDFNGLGLIPLSLGHLGTMRTVFQHGFSDENRLREFWKFVIDELKVGIDSADLQKWCAVPVVTGEGNKFLEPVSGARSIVNLQ